MTKTRGFSLVELSIVLVILGLLVGGVLTGQSLIRAAELRSVTTEYSNLQAAVHTFKDKYFAVPGDMNNATQFWGRVGGGAGQCATKATDSDTGLPTCNGNGNGLVIQDTDFHEHYRFWEHLAAAGLIAGTYTGVASNGAAGYEAKSGVNTPKSKIENAGFASWYWSSGYSSANAWPGDYSKLWFYGRDVAGALPESSVFKPEEMWNIDTKIDDGKPGRGRLRVPRNTSTCATTTDAATAEYALTLGTKICSAVFLDVY